MKRLFSVLAVLAIATVAPAMALASSDLAEPVIAAVAELAVELDLVVTEEVRNTQWEVTEDSADYSSALKYVEPSVTLSVTQYNEEYTRKGWMFMMSDHRGEVMPGAFLGEEGVISVPVTANSDFEYLIKVGDELMKTAPPIPGAVEAWNRFKETQNK